MLGQTLVSAIDEQMVWQTETMGKLSRIKEVVKKLGIGDFYEANGGYFRIEYFHDIPQMIFVTYQDEAFKVWKEAIEKAVGARYAWTTSFNEANGEFSFKLVFDGVEFIVLKDAKSCQVEVTEEEVTIPAQTKKVKKFVLKGKDCGEPPAEPVPAQEVAAV